MGGVCDAPPPRNCRERSSTVRPDHGWSRAALTVTTVSVATASAKVGGTLTAEEWQVTQSNRFFAGADPRKINVLP